MDSSTAGARSGARRKSALGSVLALALVASGGALAAPATAAATAEPDAAKLYHDYCSVCHGDAGDGNSRARGSFDPPPRDFTSAAAAAELDRDRMIRSVTEGRPGTAMAGWHTQLTATQIAAVVDFVRDQFMRAHTDPEIERGGRLFAANCSVCHGDRGDGRSRASGSLYPPPRDFTSAQAAADLTRERMIFSVTNGRPNTAMAGWEAQLPPADIEAVVDFVRARFMRPTSVASAAAAPAGHAHQHVVSSDPSFMAEGFAGGLEGDAEWGEHFYRDNCATCHGESGDGRGPRAYFILPKPRDFGHLAARRSLNRPHLFDAIAHGTLGTVMPAWDKVLTRQEIANVAEYVYRAFIATASSTAPAMPAAPGGGHDHGHGHGDHGTQPGAPAGHSGHEHPAPAAPSHDHSHDHGKPGSGHDHG
ncbi:MAG: c-type cytochrome [Ectothiorhodospiraceae bacterium]|nr:c-type cytochrome [Ectothiorhodospiraceae bacterium]